MSFTKHNCIKWLCTQQKLFHNKATINVISFELKKDSTKKNDKIWAFHYLSENFNFALGHGILFHQKPNSIRRAPFVRKKNIESIILTFNNLLTWEGKDYFKKCVLFTWNKAWNSLKYLLNSYHDQGTAGYESCIKTWYFYLKQTKKLKASQRKGNLIWTWIMAGFGGKRSEED